MMFVLLACPGMPASAVAQAGYTFKLAAVKYRGGGDWYQAKTPLPNLLKYVHEHTLIDVAPDADVVELTSDKLFAYPFLFLSGHGNVVVTKEDARRLRRYLDGGGFLYIDDDYGLDQFIRRAMKIVFPEQEFVELPFGHAIYHAHFDFPYGLPKIHEHDGKPPQGFGLFCRDGRLCVFYSYESNISDGWESPGVHGDLPEKREAALKMGVNILAYALMQ